MSRDGKSKFYRYLNLPRDTHKLIRTYNKFWKKQVLDEEKGCDNGFTGKIYTLSLENKNVS